MNVYAANQLYQADQITIEKQGISSTELMERAATQVFNWFHQRLQGAPVPIHIFCGIGNNGGDGLVLGRLLIEHGYSVHVYIANFTDKRSDDFLENYDRIKEVTNSWPILLRSADDFPAIQQEDIIVDCIFGIGLNRPPEGWVKKLIQYINQQKAFTLAVDIPSGLSANEALLDPEAVIQANHTLSFQAPKLNFFLPETGKFVPYFEVLDIGLDQEFLMGLRPLAQVVYKPLVQGLYRQREKFSHKGTYGHTLIMGGSKGKIGAMVLSSRAALKTGAGWVSAYVPACGNDILQTAAPEVMCESDSAEVHLESFTTSVEPAAIAIGMGMGTEKATQKGFLEFLESVKCPVVIDADALNCLSQQPVTALKLPANAILTPHEGELKRLLGSWDNDLEKIEKAKNFSKKHHCTLILKGANSLIIQGDLMYINSTGNPGMATAGSGDVLSGMLAGLLAQGYTPLEAAIMGVYLHGSAGNIASQELGYEALIASSIIDNIGAAFLGLFQQEQAQNPEGETTSQ